MLFVYISILLISFYVMAIITEEFFVPSLDSLSKKLKLSSDAAGATLMAIGSSAPEFFTALFAVLSSSGVADVGAGTIVGSAIFNILVIVGASAMFKSAQLTWHVAIRDISFYIISILLLMFAFMDGKIVLYEALIFVGAYVMYVLAAVNWKKWFKMFEHKNHVEEVEDAIMNAPFADRISSIIKFVIPHPDRYKSYYPLTFLMSILFIAFLSHALVESAVGIGEILHISPTIIALTVLAAGTSIPDLLSSIIVARQGRGDMAISNGIGSNIFDILICLGLPWTFVLLFRQSEVVVGTANLFSSVVLLFATVIALLFILIARHFKISRRAGLVLILIYLAYIAYNIYAAACMPGYC